LTHCDFTTTIQLVRFTVKLMGEYLTVFCIHNVAAASLKDSKNATERKIHTIITGGS
jgi:hypothetical protein